MPKSNGASKVIDRRFLFLLASARSGGNSETLARQAADGLPPDVPQVWLDLHKTSIPRFQDLRHPDRFGPLEGVAASLAEETLSATDIVLVAPLYWYSLPATAKLYLDHWSHWMRVPELRFKECMAQKTLWLVMAHSGSSPDEISPVVEGLRLTAKYLNTKWGGALLGDANAPGDIANDKAALTEAQTFFLSCRVL